MRVPRLRWPASSDTDVLKYRIFRWRGTRPARPLAIMDVLAAHKIITVRMPVRLIAANTYELPLIPLADGPTDLLIDGISTPFERDDAIIHALTTVESWRLVEAVFNIYGMEELDAALAQTGVTYYGPTPNDYSLTAELWDLELKQLIGTAPGRVEITWLNVLKSGGGTLYSYEVRSVDHNGIESEPSPIRSIVMSDVGNILALVERSEDGILWHTADTTSGTRWTGICTTTQPDQVRNVQCATTYDIGTAKATVIATWDFYGSQRLTNSSMFRLTPLLGATRIGPVSEQVGPIPLTIPVEGALVRIRQGATPSATGPDATSVQFGDTTVKTAIIDELQANTTYKIGIFTKEPTGIYANPVVITVVVGDLTQPNAPIVVTIA